jgi:hypothetical protein
MIFYNKKVIITTYTKKKHLSKEKRHESQSLDNPMLNNEIKNKINK